jgi:site-specific DNA-methyltransferase (cytosine-N4-specific)
MTTLVRKAIYTREDENALIAEGNEWNFHEEETKEHLHTIHPYPAKFIPQIPRKAIELWSKPNDLVYDPFSGCGTTLLEASLAERRAIGTDNNAVAILAARAKTALYTKTDLAFIHRFLKSITCGLAEIPKRPDLIPDNKNFLYWFAPIALQRLAALKGLILAEKEPIQNLLMAILSSIVVRVSYQDSDTRYSRKFREVKDNEVDVAFRSRLADVIERLPHAMIPIRTSVNIVQADARHVPFIESESVSLIVTSPPYLNAYDYHKYHRQRLHWIGGSVEFARDTEIGSHDEFTRKNATPDGYFRDMDRCFEEWARILKTNGRCLIVVGDAIVSKKAINVGDRFIDLLAARGIVEEKRWIRTLHSTKRAFNVKNSRISHEHVLLVKKR